MCTICRQEHKYSSLINFSKVIGMYGFDYEYLDSPEAKARGEKLIAVFQNKFEPLSTKCDEEGSYSSGGSMRIVFAKGDYVVKLPRFDSWQSFAHNCLVNILEYHQYQTATEEEKQYMVEPELINWFGIPIIRMRMVADAVTWETCDGRCMCNYCQEKAANYGITDYFSFRRVSSDWIQVGYLSGSSEPKWFDYGPVGPNMFAYANDRI